MLDVPSSLVLPAPPPAPPVSAVSRTASLPSAPVGDSAPSVRSGPAGEEGGEELKEVSVDDLTREISDLSSLTTALSTSLKALIASRDAVIASGPLAAVADLHALASQTTSLGTQLTSVLPTALSTTSQRLSRLEALAAQGTVAALPLELSTLREGLLTAQSDARRTERDVRAAAWDEVDARESARRRLEERVRAENAAAEGWGENEVEQVVRTAFVGAQARVRDLDVLSYAGRVALENPATELAQLLDEAGDAHSVAQLSRTDTRYSGATTLVDPFADDGEYAKHAGDDDEDVEKRLLTRMATSSTRNGGGGALVGGVGAAVGQKKLGRWTMLRLHWREYLLRLTLLVSSVGLVVGVVVCAFFAASLLLTLCVD
ncbi:putative membrane protein [Rhodotorula diobovata]|uniref:Putative membrane protein n=1 Tax=Rhodotorula diobovata TaxID=5288 RepID=A0A5C5FNH5_9BASI|nr:putative membrane protein [Rhodotorula diobovata]